MIHLKSRGVLSLCTYQPHRIPSLSFPPDPVIKKAYGRGHYIEKTATVDGMPVTAVKWLDNRGVHLLSNFVGSLPETKASRYDRVSRSYQEISCPNIVQEYNKFMGGIDSFDSYISLYRTKTKSSAKYYKRIFFHIMDMFVINSWLLYRRDSMDLGEVPKSILPLWDFKAEIAEKLSTGTGIRRKRFSEVSHGHLTKQKRGRAQPLPTDSMRRDGVDHLPYLSAKRATCKNPGCSSKVRTICSKCSGTEEIHLCVSEKNCFFDFHVLWLNIFVQIQFCRKHSVLPNASIRTLKSSF